MTGETQRELSEIAEAALDVAREAGELILPLFQNVAVELKPDGNLPLFGVLLGLLRDGDPVVGVAHFPALGETLWASRDSGWLAPPRRR